MIMLVDMFIKSSVEKKQKGYMITSIINVLMEGIITTSTKIINVIKTSNLKSVNVSQLSNGTPPNLYFFFDC